MKLHPSSDGQVKVWEVATKQCLHTFTEHSDQVGNNLDPGFEPLSPWMKFKSNLKISGLEREIQQGGKQADVSEWW